MVGKYCLVVNGQKSKYFIVCQKKYKNIPHIHLKVYYIINTLELTLANKQVATRSLTRIYGPWIDANFRHYLYESHCLRVRK